jgi:hypothetical protein
MSAAADPEDPGLIRDQTRMFDELTQLGRLLEADRVAEAAEIAAALRTGFERRPVDPALAGFAAMLLDAALWLLGRGRDGEALALCDVVIERLAGGGARELAAVGGARFLAAQAAGRRGQAEASRAHLEALSALGEPALAALDRLTGRLSATGADPAWHAQVAAASVTVLWRLGRFAEARVIADEAAAAFTRAGRPELAARLQALGAEIADRS